MPFYDWKVPHNYVCNHRHEKYEQKKNNKWNYLE